LICRNLASPWEHEQVSLYPEMALFIDKLKSLIEKHPERGLPVSIFLSDGRTLLCKKHSVRLTLFPPRYSIGYDFITAIYLIGNDGITIVEMEYK